MSGRGVPLVGRAAVTDSLARSWRSADPTGVVVSGLPGVGRSRLAMEALSGARAAGHDTRWAVGTAAMAAVPLGALTHLVTGAAEAATTGGMLHRAVTELTRSGAERGAVLVFDDAHLLDELSLAVVHQLAVTDAVRMVLTVRSDRPAPDLVSSLCKDGWASRLRVEPLDRVGVDEMAGTMLGGILDAQSTEKLWRSSGGHPLFVRELVAGGLDSGVLRERGATWRWEGPVVPSQDLVDIVHTQWGPLEPEERCALELLSIDQPLGVDCLADLADLAGASVVTALGRRGLVEVEQTPSAPQVRLAHPLHGVVAREAMSESRARTLRRRLLAGTSGPPGGGGTHPDTSDDDDLLRTGRLILDSDAPESDPDLLAAAATRANDALDHRLAERLGRAALDRGAGFPAHLAVAEAVRWQGGRSEAGEIGSQDAATARSPEENAQAALTAALERFAGGDAPTVTDTVLSDVDDGSGDPATLRVRAARGVLAYFAGHPGDAADTGRRVLAQPDADPLARAWGASALTVGSAATGSGAEALIAADKGRRELELVSAAPEGAFARLVLAHGEFLALSLLGRLDDAEKHVAEAYEQSTAAPGSVGDAVLAHSVGWSALATGRPRTAIRWLAGAAAGLSRSDPIGSRRLCLAHLAHAHALVGDVIAAREAFEAAGTAPHPTARVFEPEVLLARAWQAAAEGRVGEAVDRAVGAAASAAETGQWMVEARALHSVVRFGRPSLVADRLHSLTELVEGPLCEAWAEQARAAVAGDGERLDAVAQRFLAMGAQLLGADAVAQSATAHLRRGRPRQAAAAACRAADLAHRCEDARTPAIGELRVPSLTAREREVAALAGQELSNQAIADRLGRSVRTAEAHLASTYVKLGVHSRTELREVLHGLELEVLHGAHLGDRKSR